MSDEISLVPETPATVLDKIGFPESQAARSDQGSSVAGRPAAAAVDDQAGHRDEVTSAVAAVLTEPGAKAAIKKVKRSRVGAEHHDESQGEAQESPVLPDATAKPAEIIYLDPTTLTDHPEARHIPRTDSDIQAKITRDMAVTGFRPQFPIRVLPDRKTIVDGRKQRDAAIQNKIPLVPCIVDTSDDPVDNMYVAALLRERLTDDQYAYVQYCRMKHLSAMLKAARGRKAAAARYKSLLGKNTDKQAATGKRDARKETALESAVSEYRLRQLANIEKKEAEAEVAPENSAMLKIRDGIKTIRKAHDEVVGVEEDRELLRRLAEAANMRPVEAWRDGSQTSIVHGLEPQSIRLLILDLTHMADPDTTLKTVFRFMMKECGVILITDFHHERTGIQALVMAGYEIIDRVIWYEELSDAVPRGQGLSAHHHSIILARRGTIQFLRSDDTRLLDPLVHPRDKGHDDALPAALVKDFIEVGTVEGELVAIPFDRLASGYIVARQMRRKVVATDYGDGHLLGRKRIDEVFDEPVRVDQAIEAQIAAVDPSLPASEAQANAPVEVTGAQPIQAEVRP